MSKDLYIQRLRAVPLFSTLSKRELDLIVRQTDSLRYPARYRVVREGTPGEEFWMVIDGELAVTRGGVEVATLGPGDYFGEISLIDGKPRSATIRPEGKLRTLSLTAWKFQPLLEKHPTLNHQLLLGLCAHVREAEARAAG